MRYFMKYIFTQLTWLDFVNVAVGFFFIVTILFALLIFPCIYKLFVIPKIEKKIGNKLIYHPFVYASPLSKFVTTPLELSMYVINRYRAFKRFNDRGLPQNYNKFSLKTAGYTINMISKSEIILSYMVQINGILILITIVAGSILGVMKTN